MKLSNLNPKRQTKRLVEVNERTMLVALESQLDVEVNALSEALITGSRSINRLNAVEVVESLTKEVADIVVVISQLKSAILEIKDNDPTAKSKLVSDMANKIVPNYAADDIPF